ncbi:hypothetical protein [Luteimonas saliphila]|uniref:hypothetical protein n=1 Tax=Luteimonas saliphila TaxID=2804919 RepID=UPI00192DBEFE|nr:hypothetical protein [Luteimonas saliphila]
MGRLFWKITRYARAARFWLFVMLAVAAFFGCNEARAACVNTEGFNWSCQYQDEAYAKASEVTPAPYGYLGWGCNSFRGGVGNPPHSITGYWQGYSVATICANPAYTGNNFSIISWAQQCPAGQTFNESTNNCECESGSVAQPDGSCKSCGDLNGEPGSPSMQGTVTRDFKSRCVGGCALSMTSGWCTSIGGVGGGAMLCSGEYLYTGASCSASPPAPEGPEDPEAPEPPTEPPQTCKPAGAGQTFCVKPNGDQCASSARTGRQFCWKPTQTGEQTADNTMQTRGAGTEPKPPGSLNTHGGDTLVPAGNSVTTVSTNTTSTGGAGTVVIVTTTQNYETQNGTDAGAGDDDDEPDDGSGRPGSDGDDGTSASGGGNCDTPPIVSDPALEMVATQAWATRCAVEAGNAAAVTGDIGDCQQPFTVDGTNANAEQLRGLRAQICGAEGRAAQERGERESDAGIFGAAADALEPSEGDSVFSGEGDGASLSTTRFGSGGGTCPAISAFVIPEVGEVDVTWLCSALAALRFLFLALVTIQAIRIVGGE